MRKVHRTPSHLILINTVALLMILSGAVRAQYDIFTVVELLKLAGKDPQEALPKDTIYFKENIIYCTGTSRVATVNNKAADLMLEGNFTEGAAVLEGALKNAALFFPFRYNLGTCYFHSDNLRKALLNYQKAIAVVPELSKTYLQIGMIYQRWYRDNEAIFYYREALKKNRNELNTYILIGDLFFNRNQIHQAKKYYDASLSIYHRFPNGLLGRAKIHFKQGEYYKALVLIKSINMREEYDKSLHYYYAECSFKLRDYKTASEQYAILLTYKSDRFFLTNSRALIEHKLNLSNRFVEK